MANQAVTPGQILAGKYSVERVLGTGAMGMVLAATHLALGTRVAIKIMLGGGKNTDEHQARFLREARVAAMLRSQHAGKVLDVGLTEAGAPYIVMEFLDGRDLATLLQERGKLPIQEAVTYILQACEAIAEAHALGIVHRDIKPANLFLTTGVDGGPCVKVVDFGVAKQIDADVALTHTGAAMGSPLYMAPEQIRAVRDVDGRADIWALGVTLYQLLAQVTPFHTESLMVLITLVTMEPPTPLAEHRPDVPAGLAAAIMQCFEKDRARRWPNIAAFAAAIAPYGGERARTYAERVASVAKVEVPESRPTTELPQPTDAALRVAAAPQVALTAAAMSAPVAARPPAASGRALPIAAAVLAIGLPLALFLGLRARPAERPSLPASADPPALTAPPEPAVADTVIAPTPPSAIPAAAPTGTAPSSAAPAASPAPVPHPRAATSSALHAPPKAKDADTILGGSRR
jgi:serine/threonine-protein kinase